MKNIATVAAAPRNAVSPSSSFLRCPIIRDRADHRKKKDLAGHRNTDQVGIQTARIHGNSERVNESLGIRGGLGERGEIRPQEHRQHRGKVRRVRPVVEVPAALFTYAVLGG